MIKTRYPMLTVLSTCFLLTSCASRPVPEVKVKRDVASEEWGTKTTDYKTPKEIRDFFVNPEKHGGLGCVNRIMKDKFVQAEILSGNQIGFIRTSLVWHHFTEGFSAFGLDKANLVFFDRNNKEISNFTIDCNLNRLK